MMDRRVVLPVLLTALAVGACGKKAPPPAPTPQPDTAAINQARRDSIAAAEAAERARRDREAAAARAAAEAAQHARDVLTQEIYFDYDKSDIRDDAKATLDQKVAVLRSNPDVHLLIAGNADERGSTEYNLALGQRRAEAAKAYITGFGIDASRIQTESWGEERPADPGHDEAAWARNRRDVFQITAGGQQLTMPGGGR